MYERGIRDGGLVAATHIERMDAFEMYKRTKGGLVAHTHIQHVNALRCRLWLWDVINRPITLPPVLLENTFAMSPYDFL